MHPARLPATTLPPPCRPRRRGLLLLRGLLGFGAISSLYAAVQLLPLADAAVLGLLTPVFVAAGAPLALGERAGCGVALALPLSLAGVVMVARPEFIFGAGAQALSVLGVCCGIGQVRRRGGGRALWGQCG